MLNYTFRNKKDFNIKEFISNIDNLIKSQELTSRYLSIQVGAATKDNDIYDLGNSFIVDKNNNKSISACKNYFKYYYIEYFKSNLEIIQLTITYNRVKRNDYIEYIKDFYKNRNSFIND